MGCADHHEVHRDGDAAQGVRWRSPRTHPHALSLTTRLILPYYRVYRPVTSVCLSAEGDTIFSVSQDSSLKIYSRPDKRQLRSVNVSELALSACALSKDGRSVFVSSWDNNVYVPTRFKRRQTAQADVRPWPFICAVMYCTCIRYVYNVDYGRILDTLSGHDDAISCIRLRDSTLVTASWDSTIKVFTLGLDGCGETGVTDVHIPPEILFPPAGMGVPCGGGRLSAVEPAVRPGRQRERSENGRPVARPHPRRLWQQRWCVPPWLL